MADLKIALDDVYHWEKTSPNRVWMTQPVGGGRVERYTWGQAMDQVRRMAAHLNSLELPPKSNIAIISKNCAHFILSDLAIWMAGHVSVALYPTLNAETIGYILEHSEAKLLFIGKLDDWDEVQKGISESLSCISMPLAPKNDAEQWETITSRSEPVTGHPTREPEDAALIIYTSGSTGRPKGVVHNFGGMAAAIDGCEKLFQATSNDRMISYLPLAHVFERAVIEVNGFRSGMQIFFAESLDTFLADLNRAQPTLFVSVPRLWLKFQLGVFKKLPPEKLKMLLRIPILNRIIKKKILTGLGLQNVRMALSGSAPIPADLIQWYRNLGLELLEGYGMSEDFAYSHVTFPGRGRAGYVGEAMPGVQVKLSNEGEILINSPAKMVGYYKQEEMSAECFTEEGYFHTGDRGERDEAGRLKITGRVKEIFKTSKGKYVAPAPIENLLNSHNKIELSCVSGSGRPKPYALILPSEELREQLTNAAIRKEFQGELELFFSEVNRKVEAFEQLQFFAITSEPWTIENGRLTPTMKIKRAQLEESYDPELDTWYDANQRVVWES